MFFLETLNKNYCIELHCSLLCTCMYPITNISYTHIHVFQCIFLINVCPKNIFRLHIFKRGERKNKSCDSHLTSKCLFAIGGHFEFYVFCKMPQLVFTATFIMLLCVTIVTIVKLKACKDLYNLEFLFQFLPKIRVIYQHIVPLKQNKVCSLFITFTLREMRYLVYSVPPMTRCK